MGAWQSSSAYSVDTDAEAAGADLPPKRLPRCTTVDTVEFHNPLSNSITDIWILAGQSNTVGENESDEQAIPDIAQPLPGKILMFTPDGKWVDAVPNVHVGTHGYGGQNSVGPDMAFAHTLIKLGISSRVGLVPTAQGGTNLYDQWAVGSDLYKYMLQHTKAAMAALPGARLRGMIWVQGESDGDTQENASAYGKHFTAFATAVRNELYTLHPLLPIIQAVMATRKRDCFPFIEEIRAQQLALKMQNLIQVDMCGYEFFEQYPIYLVHLTKAGQCAMGEAMAHSYYSSIRTLSTLKQ